MLPKEEKKPTSQSALADPGFDMIIILHLYGFDKVGAFLDEGVRRSRVKKGRDVYHRRHLGEYHIKGPQAAA